MRVADFEAEHGVGVEALRAVRVRADAAGVSGAAGERSGSTGGRTASMPANEPD